MTGCSKSQRMKISSKLTWKARSRTKNFSSCTSQKLICRARELSAQRHLSDGKARCLVICRQIRSCRCLSATISSSSLIFMFTSRFSNLSANAWTTTSRQFRFQSMSAAITTSRKNSSIHSWLFSKNTIFHLPSSKSSFWSAQLWIKIFSGISRLCFKKKA